MLKLRRGPLGAVLALALSMLGLARPALAADPNRLFPDSRLIVYDRISVEVIGQGPDVILVPGLASSRTVWRETAERLKGRFRLHLVQVAGFTGAAARGNAQGPVLIPTAQAIDLYVRQAHIAPVIYVGHSLGGTMGLWLAQNHPEHFSRMMLVDAWPAYARTLTQGAPITPEKVQSLAEDMRSRTLVPPMASGATQMRARFRGMTRSPERQAEILAWSRDSAREVVAQALYDDILLDLSPGLAQVRTPVTLVYPDNTPVHMPKGMADRIYQGMYVALPSKRLVRVDDALHFVMWDQPAAFAAVLDEFLAP